MNKIKIKLNQIGFSVVEVLIAAAVLGVLMASIAPAVLSFGNNIKTSGHKQQAVALAEEALEAARNIRDNVFSNLADGTFGLATTTNQWNFSGSSDTNGIFTRQTLVSTVNTNQKQISSTVSWQESSNLSRSVSLSTYLTNWQAVLSSALGGLLIYGDGTTVPKYRTYDTSTNLFSSQISIATSSIGSTFIVRSSPIKTEAVAGFVSASGVLTVLCYNGSVWNQEWTDNVGGNGTTRRFDIAYETNSGDVLVLYSTNTATTNELHYRTKPGSSLCGSGNWSVVNDLNPIRTSGIVHWVKMAWDRRSSSDLITAIWADANSDLSAMVWSGTAWGNEPTTTSETSLEVVGASQDVEDFDVEYESLSGDVMVIWSNSIGSATVNGVRYRTCNGGVSGCTWGATTSPPTLSNDATNLDISANPNSNEIVFASIGNGGADLQLGYWSGSAWTNTNDADTSCNVPVAGEKLVSTGWLISGGTTRSVIRYADQGSSAVDWYVGNAGVFSKQADFVPVPALANPDYIDIQMDPQNLGQFLVFASHSGNSLLAKRLVMTSVPAFTWSNSDGSALSTTLTQSINSPYSFSFWRH